jgi:TRAP-type mannitol/chloroaromatic compound transport system permease small subunit
MQPHKAYRTTEKIISRMSQAFGGMTAATILMLMMMLTVSDVLARALFNHPITGSADITQFAMICIVFPVFAWGAVKGMHVKVDIIVGRLSHKAQTIIDIINYIFVLGVCVLLGSQSFLEAFVARRLGIVSNTIGIPHYPFYLVITLGFVLLFLVTITLLGESISKAAKR